MPRPRPSPADAAPPSLAGRLQALAARTPVHPAAGPALSGLAAGVLNARLAAGLFVALVSVRGFTVLRHSPPPPEAGAARGGPPNSPELGGASTAGARSSRRIQDAHGVGAAKSPRVRGGWGGRPSPADATPPRVLTVAAAARRNQDTPAIRGTVFDAGERPLPGVMVWLLPEQGVPRDTTTGEDGRYRFDGLPLGRFTVVARKPGFASQRQEQHVTAAQQVLGVSFRLKPNPVEPWSVTGQVVRRDDLAPVAGGTIRLYRVPGLRRVEVEGRATDTDAAGCFTFTQAKPGRYQLWASAPGYVLRWLPPFELREGDDRHEAVIHLTRAVTMTGTVRDERGRPLAAARLRWLPARPDRVVPNFHQGIETESRADGTYHLAGVPPEEGELHARKSGHTKHIAVCDLTGRTGEVALDVVLRPLASVWLRGRILLADGTPAAGWNVEPYVGGHVSRTSVIPRPVTPAGVVGQGAGAGPVAPPAPVAVPEGGQPPAPPPEERQASPGWQPEVNTDERGEFRVGPVPAGRGRLGLARSGDQLLSPSYEARPGADTTLPDTRLAPTGVLEGLVKGAEPAPGTHLVVVAGPEVVDVQGEPFAAAQVIRLFVARPGWMAPDYSLPARVVEGFLSTEGGEGLHVYPVEARPVPLSQAFFPLPNTPANRALVALEDERFRIAATGHCRVHLLTVLPTAETSSGTQPLGYVLQPGVRVLAEPGRTAHLQLTMHPAGSLRGRVVDPDGRPLERAEVALGRPGSLERLGFAFTREDGSFDLSGLAPGAYEARIWEYGCAGVRRTFTIGAGATTQLDVRLASGVPCRGRVGAPEPGRFYVSAESDGGFGGAKVAEDGTFTVERLLPGTYTLHLWAPGEARIAALPNVVVGPSGAEGVTARWP